MAAGATRFRDVQSMVAALYSLCALPEVINVASGLYGIGVAPAQPPAPPGPGRVPKRKRASSVTQMVRLLLIPQSSSFPSPRSGRGGHGGRPIHVHLFTLQHLPESDDYLVHHESLTSSPERVTKRARQEAPQLGMWIPQEATASMAKRCTALGKQGFVMNSTLVQQGGGRRRGRLRRSRAQTLITADSECFRVLVTITLSASRRGRESRHPRILGGHRRHPAGCGPPLPCTEPTCPQRE